MDQEQYLSLLSELEQARAEIESAGDLKEELHCARDTIDVQFAELEAVKCELAEVCRCTAVVAPTALPGESLGEELVCAGGHEPESLSLEDEMKRVEANEGSARVSY